MVCCCGHHHHCMCHGGWHQPYPPYRWRGPASPREEYLRTLEEEREILERRLRRLDRELEGLRQASRPEEERD